VRDAAACAALTADERQQLAKLGHHRRLHRGEVLFSAGDANAISATLTKGVLKVSNFDRDGTEHIVSLIHPAGFAGELFAPIAQHEIVALTESEVCVFPRKEYERSLERFPALARALLRRSTGELTETRSLLASVTSRTAMQRVSGLLIALSRAANDVECHTAQSFDLVLTRGEIASFLGMTIETVSRQLTKLESEGVIRRNGARGVEIIDAARLGNLSR
jgi:CRP/FNR family transcriptional regulator